MCAIIQLAYSFPSSTFERLSGAWVRMRGKSPRFVLENLPVELFIMCLSQEYYTYI